MPYIIYKTNAGSSKYIAGNWIKTTNGGKDLIESDIVFNVDHAFTNGAQRNAFDTWYVFLHETGHTLGLADTPSNINDAIMYSGSIADTIRLRTNSSNYRIPRSDDKKALATKGY